jgi:hypothetical protein
MTPPAVRLPNFFLAGAPKAGTSSLYAYVRQHPQVYMSGTKEPTFFGAADILPEPYRDRVERRAARGNDVVRKGWQAVPGRRELIADWEDYVDLFRNVRGEAAIGEASVDYFWLPSAAQAIHARLPDARFVFMLRDPADRLFSEYLASLWRGLHYRTFRSQFLAAVDAPDPWARLRVDVGRYTTHLARFSRLFSRHQIRVYLYEDFRADPAAVLRDVFRFLGIDPAHPIDRSRWVNEPILPRFSRLHALRRRVLGEASATRWLPEGARQWLQRLYRSPRGDMVMDPADRRAVIDYYRDEILQTADLLGRDLSAWLR